MARIAIVGIISGLAIGLFAGVFTWVVSKPSFTVSNELDVALRQVLKGEFDLANAIAEKHKLEELEQKSDKAKKELVEGCHAWMQSQKSLDHQISFERAEVALQHLLEAEKYGFPEGYDGLGNFVLGMVRKHLQQSDEALKPLRIAAERFPQQRSLAIPAIIDILLHRAPPAVEEARQVLEHWKTLPALNQSDLDRAAVSLSQILVAEQKIQEALAEAKRLGQNSPSYVPSQLLQANTLRVQSQVAKDPQKQSLIEEAYGIVENLVDSPLVKPHERREAMYLSGLLLRDLGKPKEALGMFSNLRIGHPETPESLASGVEEMEILIELGEADQVPAIASYFAKQLEHPERLKSPRFVPELLRSRMIAVGKQLIDKGFYDLAATYAQILPNLCTDTDRIRIESEAHRKHGEHLVREAGGNVDRFGTSSARLSTKEFKDAKPYFQRAGKLYEKLAFMELRSSDYADLLWTAIECYQSSDELERSNDLIDLYMNLERKSKHPRAYLAKGENYLAMGDSENALKQFGKLIQNYSDNPLADQARSFSAQALSEQLQFDDASKMLNEILYEGSLTPQSNLWRDSLFQLGSLHFRHAEVIGNDQRKLEEAKSNVSNQLTLLEDAFKEYQKCIEVLEEAVQRYDSDERSFQAQYLLAEAYRKSANWPKKLLEQNLLSTEEKRSQRSQQKVELLQRALNVFSTLRKKINSRPDATDLEPKLQSILRNSYFGEADILFELKDYEGALAAYRNTANRYRFEPESLEAMMRVSQCYEKLDKKRDAKQTVLQAQQILKSIPSEKDNRFPEVTSYSRKQWDQHLNWLVKNSP